jgi:hypothetical protein
MCDVLACVLWTRHEHYMLYILPWRCYGPGDGSLAAKRTGEAVNPKYPGSPTTHSIVQRQTELRPATTCKRKHYMLYVLPWRCYGPQDGSLAAKPTGEAINPKRPGSPTTRSIDPRQTELRPATTCKRKHYMLYVLPRRCYGPRDGSLAAKRTGEAVNPKRPGSSTTQIIDSRWANL